MWPSEDTAVRLANWANTGLIISLVLGVVSTVLVVWMGNVKEAYLQADLTATKNLAAKADLKRIALENRILDTFGPRRLTPDQSAQIVKGLLGLKGVKIDVYVVDPGNSFTPNEEPVNLGRDFVKTLRAAHMDAKGWLMGSCADGVQASTVTIVSIDRDGPDHGIALRVLHAFKSAVDVWPQIGDTSPACTKFTDLDKDDPNKRLPGANIRIAIGRKIQPILTRALLEQSEETDKP